MANYAIIIYSMYHHVATMAESVKKGVESNGDSATIYQVAETLPKEVLAKMHAPTKPDYPIATPEILAAADGVLFGVPTRFGSYPAQLKSFIDATGGQWASGGLYGKPAGVFVSTGTGVGRETTVFSLISTFAHHGMIYIPLGYAKAFGELTNLNEVQGGSPWGAGTIAGGDGSRQPSELELKTATIQGESFAQLAGKIVGTTGAAEQKKKRDTATPVEKFTEKKTVKEVKKATAAVPKSEKNSCCVIC
ncbi:hypothetical protein DAMA08_024880 [Martiniozyma asiatica (nom. inval.)]|nr:hypothetical protein DAMA08_024880 [Martiniozyma asiatica]